MSKRGPSIVSLILLLMVLSFAIRLLPLMWSPIPYNIDGLSELRVSQDILSSGHLDFPSDSSHAQEYVSDMPILGVFMAFLCSFLDSDPVYSSQLTVTLLGTITISVVFLVSLQLWPSRRTAIASAAILALIGSFAFSTGCVWKESLGFFLLAIVLLAFPKRDLLSYRFLMTLPLPFLVFTHHHAAIVSFIILTFAVLVDTRRSLKSNGLTRTQHLDVVTTTSCWVLAAGYYSSISLPYVEYLSPSTDLYLYIAVASLTLLVGVYASRRAYLISRLPLGVIVPILGVSFMLYNLHDPIFPGIPAPSTSVMVPFIAYLILVVPAWYGSEVLLGKNSPSKNLLLAMLLGPLSLIVFAFLRANDATSHLIIYRTFDFLMIPFALLVGAGFAHLVKGRERLGVLAGVSLVVICASTLPVAYQTQELFGVQNHTFEFEYDAVEWFSANGVDSYASDQRLGETGWRLFDINYSRGLPYDLREGISLDPTSFFVTEGQWTYNGAQEFPFGVVVVEQAVLDAVSSEGSVMYIGGPSENQLILFMTR